MNVLMAKASLNVNTLTSSALFTPFKVRLPILLLTTLVLLGCDNSGTEPLKTQSIDTTVSKIATEAEIDVDTASGETGSEANKQASSVKAEEIHFSVELGGPQMADTATTVFLTASIETDGSTGIVNTQWEQTAGPEVFLTSSPTATLTQRTARFTTPTVTETTRLTFQFSATDSAGIIITKTVSVTVLPLPTLPTSITANDEIAPPTPEPEPITTIIQMTDTSRTVRESIEGENYSLSLPITLTPTPSVPLALHYEVTGSALPGTDFTHNQSKDRSGTLTLAAHTASTHIPITLLADETVETEKALTVTLTSANTLNPTDSHIYQFQISASNDTTLTLRDGEPQLLFSSEQHQPTYLSLHEGDAPITTEIALVSNANGEPWPALTDTVVYLERHPSASAEQSDYTLNESALLITQGTSKTYLDIGIMDDTEIEPTEVLLLELAQAENALIHPYANTLSIDVYDNDEPTVNLPTQAQYHSEQDDHFELLVSLTEPHVDKQAHVEIELSGEARYNEDYTLITSSHDPNRPDIWVDHNEGMYILHLLFEPSEQERNIVFSIANDMKAELTETVTFSVTHATHAQLGHTFHTLHLKDDIQPTFALGYDHNCLLDDSGVECWGGDFDYRLMEVPELQRPVAIASGYRHSCAIDARKDQNTPQSLHCWGDNEALLYHPYHPEFSGGQGHEPVTVSLGLDHGCLIEKTTLEPTSTEAINCWGDMGGWGDTPTMSQPYLLSSAHNYSCAYSEIDGIQCWGAPSSVGAAHPLMDVTASALTTTNEYLCYIDEGGRVTCTTDPSRSAPPDFSDIHNAVAMASGAAHTCVLTADNTLTCRGVGEGATPVPSDPLNRSILSIGAGTAHNCVHLNGGQKPRVRCWGTNRSGESLTPLPVAEVRLGLDQKTPSCLVQIGHDDERLLSCWGSNSRDIPALINVSNASAGHLPCATVEGKAQCWQYDPETDSVKTVALPVETPRALSVIEEPIYLYSRYTQPDICSLDALGTPHCWQLDSQALAASLTALVPMDVPHIEGAKSIATSQKTCVLSDLDLTCWSYEGGTIIEKEVRSHPLSDPVLSFDTTYMSTSVESGNSLICTGQSNTLECRSYDRQTFETLPTPGMSETQQIKAHDQRVCAIGTTGVQCWHYPYFKPMMEETLPISEPEKATFIDHNYNNICAILADTLVCWEAPYIDNQYGSLEVNDQEQPLPTRQHTSG